MLKTSDGTQIKRLSGKIGDRQPALGGRKQRALYTATGGETSIDLSLLTPSLSYTPSANQISVKRTSGSGLISGIDFYERTATSIGFPVADPLIAGEIVEIILDFGITSVMALAPRSDCFSQTATAGQTLITADFSWTYNLNPSKAIGGVRFEINGITQTRGIDFTEVNLGNVNTNQIVVNDAFLGGENIILTPVYQAIDTSAASTSFYGQAYANMQSAFTAGTQAFVDQSSDMISVPNTSIVNRAKIPNLANDLRASLGNERIETQSIVQLQNEFGPNGEPVFSVLNDDRGMIRFVGAGWAISSGTGTSGSMMATSTASGTAFIEVTFYGTGLNILTAQNADGRDMRAAVDGGSLGSNIFYGASSSAIINGRNYVPNTVMVAASGLTLGIHTVRVELVTLAMAVSGFEILNSNASGLININTGVGYINGQKYINTLVDSVAYNTGVTGTKGGRIVRYLNSDGTFGQAFQATDASTLYIANAVHTNEEVARVYHWREFGCGRQSPKDDFSDLSGGGARAFTLDDGTTTLIHSSAALQATEALGIRGTASLFFTFIGTGLDLVRQDDASGGADQYYAYIDNGSGQAFSTTGSTVSRIQKVVSGLAYGTHTVKIQSPSGPATWNFGIKQFIVYQPKKPSVPSSSIEICDYNVMAAYAIAGSAPQGPSLSTGILFKAPSREIVYVGTGFTGSLAATNGVGFEADTSTAGDYVQYTFFGTGIDLMGLLSSGTANTVIQIDGANYTGTATAVGSGTWTAGTSTWAITAQTLLSISTLALGVHTIKATFTGTFSAARILSVNPITPIHSYKSNLYADLQNTLTVGSNSLMDSRKTSMIKEILPAQKAWVQAIGLGRVTTTATSYVPMPDMSVTIKTSGGALSMIAVVSTELPATANYLVAAIFVDGVQASGNNIDQAATLGAAISSQLCLIANLAVSAGVHKVDVYWKTPAGTTMPSDVNTYASRTLIVEEI